MGALPASSSSQRELVSAQTELLDIADGFFQSSVLFALLDLGIFELLGEESRSAEELATRIGARTETLGRLLNAGVAYRLLEAGGEGSYRLSAACRRVLLPGEHDLSDWIRHLEYLRDAICGLDRAVLTSRPTVPPDDFPVSPPERTRQSTLAMHSTASLRARELAHFLDTSGSESLLDLGCGPGTFAFTLGLENPGLRLYLLDLPGVLEVAREIRQRYPLRNEVHYLPMDALLDEIPGTYDLVLLSNMLHSLGREESRRLVQRLAASVAPGGSLVVQGQFLRDDLMGERWPVALDLSLLCTTPAGQNHSAAEAAGWLEEAGFRDIERCPMSVVNSNSFVRGVRR